MYTTYIAVEGNIGIGKSTVANIIRHRLGYHLLLEDYEIHPFLNPGNSFSSMAFKISCSILPIESWIASAVEVVTGARVNCVAGLNSSGIG